MGKLSCSTGYFPSIAGDLNVSMNESLGSSTGSNDAADELGLGIGFAMGTSTPLFQTNFLPDLTQVYFLPDTTEVTPALLHFVPAFVDADARKVGLTSKIAEHATIAISFLTSGFPLAAS